MPRVRALRHITVTVEPEAAQWARVKDRMLEEKGYEAARRRFLAVRARRLSDGPYPGREELHDRAGLR